MSWELVTQRDRDGDPADTGELSRALEAAEATLVEVIQVNSFLRDIDRDLHGYNPDCMEYFPLTHRRGRPSASRSTH
jgi:enamine deaminase RidA (YjgF/YER057c/UK114 family)